MKIEIEYMHKIMKIWTFLYNWMNERVLFPLVVVVFGVYGRHFASQDLIIIEEVFVFYQRIDI